MCFMWTQNFIITSRRRLFHGSTKTEFCLIIEKCLSINVSQDLHTDIVCRKYIENLGRANTTIVKHKEAYAQTIAKLKHSHGRESTKRQSSEEHIIDCLLSK